MTVSSGTHGGVGAHNAYPGFGALDFSALDFSALTAPVSAAEVRRYRADAKGRAGSASPPALAAVLTAILVLVLGFVLLSITALFLRLGFADGGVASPMFLAPLAGLAIIVMVLVVFARAALPRFGKWPRWTRLDRFARANGFTFLATGVPDYPGSIFNIGRERQARDHLITASGRYVDLGNYSYSTGSGDERTIHRWSFLALKLDRALPHIVLDAKANNGFFARHSLPVSFDRDQVLSLEGDFDRYFTLYCPTNYERDALYIFTPDVLALLIDESRHFDVEIVDDWMFVYSAAALDMTDQEALRRLFRIVDTVGAKMLRQTKRYSDERASGGIVAPAGQRLRHPMPAAFVLVAVVAAVMIALNAHQLLSILFR